MSAAVQVNATIAVGDSVFVHPDDWTPPDHLRGVRGTVVAIDGVEAQLCLHSSDEVIRVEVGVLRRDRRRAPIRADWETAT